MRTISIVKLLTVFAVAFSLASITGPMAGNFHLPTIPTITPAHADHQACQTHDSSGKCAEFWYPAGPSMNTELATIFTDENAEYTAIKTAASSPIDLSDWELSTSDLNLFTTSGNFLITDSVGQVGYYELEFHLGNNFWGCNFSFGTSPCGQEIRQGIAHMIDKNSFTTNQANIGGVSQPLDNPVPTSSAGGLTTPNPCSWDASFAQSGASCSVGAAGGLSYHLGNSGTGANGIPWLQSPGSADLNAAAQHFVNFFNSVNPASATFSTSTSVLSLSAADISLATSNVPNFFIRSDNPPRKDLGESMAQAICYLFTGSYSIPCSYLSKVEGPITAFPGFTTSKDHVNENWWIYTAAFGGPTFFDGSLYFGYNSHFVSGIPSIQAPTGKCDPTSVPTASAGDYQYVCSPNYDSLSTQMETAPCLLASGDPVIGQTVTTYSFCTGTGQGYVVYSPGGGPAAGSDSVISPATPSVGFAGSGVAVGTALKTDSAVKWVGPGPSWITQPSADVTKGPTCTDTVYYDPSHVGVVGGIGVKRLCGNGVADGTLLNCSVFTTATECGARPTDSHLMVTSAIPFVPGKFSAHSAGVQAEDYFGSHVFTLPVFQLTVQFGYENNGWSRVANNSLFGISNYFTWLNAWNPAPVQSGTIRQGFKETTKSVSPFIGSTVWDLFIYGNVYDSLYGANPLFPSQTFNWMTVSTFQKDNASLAYPGESCQPAPNNEQCTEVPAHTLTTYRFTLRNDLYFQDGTQVTAFDVAFSYLNMVGSGAFAGTGASSMTGVTILSPVQFDIGVNSLGPFTLPNLTALPIMPGSYWNNVGQSQWASAATTCLNPSAGCHAISGTGAQYTLTGPSVNCITNPGFTTCATFPASLLTVNPSDTSATFDPISAHIFIGSGPWQCGTGQLSTSGSTTCSSNGAENPPIGGSYTLTRFGAGLAPASSVSQIYFRSSGNLALYAWSEANNVNQDTPLSISNACYLKPVGFDSCSHFQQGIGTPQGIGGAPAPETSEGPSVESRFYALNWLEPYQWATSAPGGIGSVTPVLYEGPVTLNPAPPGGCPGAYYDC